MWTGFDPGVPEQKLTIEPPKPEKQKYSFNIEYYFTSKHFPRKAAGTVDADSIEGARAIIANKYPNITKFDVSMKDGATHPVLKEEVRDLCPRDNDNAFNFMIKGPAEEFRTGNPFKNLKPISYSINPYDETREAAAAIKHNDNPCGYCKNYCYMNMNHYCSTCSIKAAKGGTNHFDGV